MTRLSHILRKFFESILYRWYWFKARLPSEANRISSLAIRVVKRYERFGDSEGIADFVERFWASEQKMEVSQSEQKIKKCTGQIEIICLLPGPFRIRELRKISEIKDSDLRLTVIRPGPKTLLLTLSRALLATVEMHFGSRYEGAPLKELSLLTIRTPKILFHAITRLAVFKIPNSDMAVRPVLQISGYDVDLWDRLGLWERAVPISWIPNSTENLDAAVVISLRLDVKVPTLKRRETTSWLDVIASRSPLTLLRLLTMNESNIAIDALGMRSSNLIVSQGAIILSSRLGDQRDQQDDESYFSYLQELTPVVPSTDAALSDYQELVSHAQFSHGEVVTIHDSQIWHGRFIVKGRNLVMADSGQDPRLSVSAGCSQFQYGSPLNGAHSVMQIPRFYLGQIPSAVGAFGRADKNWFHFLIETVPSALLAAADTPAETPLLVRNDLPATAYEALDALFQSRQVLIGVDQSISIRTFNTSLRRASTLDTPDLRIMQGLFDTKLLIKSRDAIWQRLSPKMTGGPKKISSMRESRYRRITNLTGLNRALRDNAFTPIQSIHLSFSEQVEFFYNAESIVLQGGAGMANLLFARPGTSVTVLVGSKGGQDQYWQSMMNALELNGKVVVGEIVGSERGPGGIHSDFQIPESDLLDVVLS